MLRRLRIRGRLQLAVLLPIAALLGFVVLALSTFQSVRVNGAEYHKIVDIKGAAAELTPTEDDVLVALNATERILLEATRSGGLSQTGIENRKAAVQAIDDAERAFRTRYLKWVGLNERLDVPVSVTEDPFDAGTAFFAAVNDSFLPQIRRGDFETAQQLLDNELTDDYRAYRAAAQHSRAALAVRQRGIEDRTATHIERRLLIMGLGAAAAVGFAAGLGFLVARSISRPVLKLTEQASRSANEELPRAIVAAQSGGSGAPTGLTPIESGTNDEFGELAGALNAMQTAAVELATEQAVARRAVADNLVHIGRRNQSLIDRTLGFISRLERDEQDPDVLANLFRLDHLTTRMRRGSESLLVLAGSDPSTTKRTPERIADVVRAALSEIELFDRIELVSLDDAIVTPGAVRPLAHLLAELLENAANFSPPSTTVAVFGRLTVDGYHLSIVDRGIGMEPDKLADANETLEGHRELLTVSTRMLGHHVVARLAARFDIVARLTSNAPAAGTTATVVLPAALLLPQPSAHGDILRPSPARASVVPPPPVRRPVTPPAPPPASPVPARTAAVPPPPPAPSSDPRLRSQPRPGSAQPAARTRSGDRRSGRGAPGRFQPSERAVLNPGDRHADNESEPS